MAAYDDDNWQYQSEQSNPQKDTTSIANPLQQSNDKQSEQTEIVKQGWSMKKGPQSYTGWKKRYLRLTSDKKLEYFTDDDLTQHKGTISIESLSVYQIQKSSKASDSKHFGFSIDTPSRTFLFSVGSSTDRDDWIQKIRGTLNTKKSRPFGTGSSMGSSTGTNDENQLPNQNGFGHSTSAYDDIQKPQKIQSKYQRRNLQKQEVLTEEEAKQRIQDLQQRNNALLDEALMTSYETMDKATNTAEVLSAQRNQLINTDKMLHEIDQDLDTTDVILTGMKSWGGMIRKKFKKQKGADHGDSYVAPVSEQSTFERRKMEQKEQSLNGNGIGNGQIMGSSALGMVENEHDQRQNAKLDELMNNVKQMRQIGSDINTELDEHNQMIDAISQKMDVVQPKMEQQNFTMKKLVQ